MQDNLRVIFRDIADADRYLPCKLRMQFLECDPDDYWLSLK